MRSKVEAEELYLQYEHLVNATLIKQFPNRYDFAKLHGLEIDDLLQIGKMGLYKAAEEYSPSKGMAFQSYAISMIKFTITSKAKLYSLRNQNKSSYTLLDSISLETPVKNGEEELHLSDVIEGDKSSFEEADMNISLELLSRVLPERTMKIIRMRLDEKTYKEIGSELNVSSQRIKQILNESKHMIYKKVLA